MNKTNNTINAFFALLKAGLWEKNVQLLVYGPVDFGAIYSVAEEQSVVGLIAAGIEQIQDVKASKQDVLPFMTQVLSLENRNAAMNFFIGVIIDKMHEAKINTVLIKGQGVAQCYERPSWRASGDVDLFFDTDNYERAKQFLLPLASSVEPEDTTRMHLGLTIDPWVVELHGTMNSGISGKIDQCVKCVQDDIFINGGVRVWNYDGNMILLPNPDNDIIIVFTHFINHFYGGGIGLRQISDWCRLLWSYRDNINIRLLKDRIDEMKLMSEWKAFAYFAVRDLGMPEESMPFYEDTPRFRRKSGMIRKYILKTGNFGHNIDESYRNRYSPFMRNVITFFRRLREFLSLSTIFPINAPKFFVTYVVRRLKVVV